MIINHLKRKVEPTLEGHVSDNMFQKTYTYIV